MASSLAHRWPYLVFVGLWLIASEGWAQGPLRRLGGRVRESIQAGGPLAPAGPAASAQARQAAPAAGANSPAGQPRFPLLRPAAAGASSANAAPRSGSSANYQRANSATNSAGMNANAAGAASGRVQGAANGGRTATPGLTASSVNRAGTAGRQNTGVAVARGGEARNLEVAKLGLKVRNETMATVDYQAGRAPRGVLVTAVLVGSGGDAAGLQSGDRVLAVDGRLVNQAEAFVNLVDQIAPGDPLELKFSRAGKLYSTVGLASGPTGKLDKEEFEIVRQQAREMIGEVAASSNVASSATPTPAAGSSPLGGIGNALGSWLGAAVGPAKADDAASASGKPVASGAPAASTTPEEPNVRNVDANEAVASEGYKSLRPNVSVLAGPVVAPNDPPSLDGAEAGYASESAVDGGAETLPAPRPASDATTIDQLLREIRVLRERVQQLESQKGSEVR